MLCHYYFVNHYKQGDIPLIQKVSSDDFGRLGHVAFIRNNLIYENSDKYGERILPLSEYFQIDGGEKIYGPHKFFRRMRWDELIRTYKIGKSYE